MATFKCIITNAERSTTSEWIRELFDDLEFNLVNIVQYNNKFVVELKSNKESLKFQKSLSKQETVKLFCGCSDAGCEKYWQIYATL